MNKKCKKPMYLALGALVLISSFGCEKNNENDMLDKIDGNYVVSKTNMSIGSKVPEGVNFRSTKELAMADWKEITGKDGITIPIYLKHDLSENNEITSSYVEFIINDELKKEWKYDNCGNDKKCAAKYDNLVNGTYTLEGGDSGSAYDKNIDTIKKAFNYAKQKDVCHDSGPEFYCEVPNLYVYARGYGDINVRNGNNICRVYSDGISHCE